MNHTLLTTTQFMDWVQEQKPEQGEMIALLFMRGFGIQHLTDLLNRHLNPQYSVEYHGIESENEEFKWKITQNED